MTNTRYDVPVPQRPPDPVWSWLSVDYNHTIPQDRGAKPASRRSNHPMTVRRVFYHASSRPVSAKIEKQYKHTIDPLVPEMGRRGNNALDWIADSGWTLLQRGAQTRRADVSFFKKTWRFLTRTTNPSNCLSER
jgi:hypothetical protein